MSSAGGITGSHIWRFVPAHIQEELHPVVGHILSRSLGDRERDGLIAYCTYYHPHIDITAAQKNQFETCIKECSSNRSSKKGPYGGPNANSLAGLSRSPLNREKLAQTVCEIGSETELLKLLGDRGPDYGLSLLILLELLFQVGFCLRRQRESNPDAITAMSYCSRLLEILALHLDAPPLWPRFTIKFGMTLTGLIYHRKLQALAATRLFQLNYFIFPQCRKYLLQPRGASDAVNGAEVDRSPLSDTYKNTLLDPKVEEMLWNLVRDLALEPPSAGTLERVNAGKRPLQIECRIDAMAIVFERLHHLATKLFGTPLYLYGSGATGFATVNSDIDVVVPINDEQEKQLLAEANEARKKHIDLNVFPAVQASSAPGPSAISNIYPLVGDWAWLDEKDGKTAAAIWLNRKFAWACYRLYGWSVQCVQSAYVPIVRVLASVDAETAAPCELPTVFMPEIPYSATLVSLFRQVDLETRSSDSVRCADTLDSMLVLIAMSRKMSISRVKRYIARTVACEIVSEELYSSWSPCLASRANFRDAKLYLSSGGISSLPGDDKALVRIENDLLMLFKIYWKNLKQRSSEGSFLLVNPRAISPALLPAKPNAKIDDGRLSSVRSSERDIFIVEADVSVGRQVGIHNSRLLRAYAQVDPRVIALGLLVKQWARACSLEDAYSGFLSGYQWTLIVIHFLQHYCCLPVPQTVQSHPEWRNLINAFRFASLGFSPCHLPLLPNLQNPGAVPSDAVNLRSKGPLIIHEIEGDLNVWFYEPNLGSNENVEDGKHWPENTILKTNPLLYAYTLLQAPHNLQDIAKKFSLNATRSSERGPASSLTTQQILSQTMPSTSKGPEAEALWTMRLKSCPRPHIDRQNDGDSTPINNSASRNLTPHLLWDAQRTALKEKMARTWNEERKETARVGFPPLTRLRDRMFVQQHVMDRADTLMDTFKTLKGEPTLAELLFGFFEYYGTRLNYATDMIDTSRTPELPQGKKEWFQTCIFDPKGADTVNSSHREVAGRGNGPFQYRGRHYLCLKDPMEDRRTVGPPYRCQTMITNSILASISALSDMNRMVDRKAVIASLDDMFAKQPGNTPAVLRGSRTPVKECLKEYLFNTLKNLSSAMTAYESSYCREMYDSLRLMIKDNGNYRNLNTTNGASGATGVPATDRPISFANQPQIGTRGLISNGVPAYRRHSVTSIPSPTHQESSGSAPKTAPPLPRPQISTPCFETPLATDETVQAPPQPSQQKSEDTTPKMPSRGRCVSLPTNTLRVPAEDQHSSNSSGGEPVSEGSSVDIGASISDSGAEEKNNQSVVGKFKDSELSWCMKATSFRRFQKYLRQQAAVEEKVWKATDYEDPIKWLEMTTGIKKATKFRQPAAAPPIRGIRSRQTTALPVSHER